MEQLTSFVKKYKFLLILLLVLTIIFVVKVFILKRISDTGWEPDDYVHFLQLRTVFADFPHNLTVGLSVWSKPLYAYPLGLLVAIFQWNSFLPVQLVNTGIILLVSVLVYLSLRRLGYSRLAAYIGLVLTNFSFLLLRSSLTAMTEPMFTLIIISGYYLLLIKKYKLAALVIGLSVLGRIEGALFVIIWIVFFLQLKVAIKQKIIYSVIAILPAAIWNLIGFMVTGRILYLIQSGYPTQRGLYGFGGWLHYFYGMLIQEPLLVAMLGISLFSLIQLIRKRDYLRALPFISFSLFFMAQVVFWKLGMFGTAGLMRYFIGVMPFMIISALTFWPLIETKRTSIWITAIILLATQLTISFSILRTGGYFEGLLSYPEINPAIVTAGKWIQDNIAQKTSLYVDQPAVIYYARRDLQHSSTSLGEALQTKTPGIYVWSEEWGEKVEHVKLSDMQKYRQLKSFNDFIYVFEIK